MNPIPGHHYQRPTNYSLIIMFIHEIFLVEESRLTEVTVVVMVTVTVTIVVTETVMVTVTVLVTVTIQIVTRTKILDAVISIQGISNRSITPLLDPTVQTVSNLASLLLLS